MKAKLIKTVAEYEEALARVDDLMSAQPDTPRFDEFELWTHLVEVYESEHVAIAPPAGCVAEEREVYRGARGRTAK